MGDEDMIRRGDAIKKVQCQAGRFAGQTETMVRAMIADWLLSMPAVEVGVNTDSQNDSKVIE